MTNGSDLAFPQAPFETPGGGLATLADFRSTDLGLTKREAFAMAAITATAPHLVGANDRQVQEFADAAVKIADAMVAALNRKEGEQ